MSPKLTFFSTTHCLLFPLHANHVAALADVPQAQVWGREAGCRYFFLSLWQDHQVVVDNDLVFDCDHA